MLRRIPLRRFWMLCITTATAVGAASLGLWSPRALAAQTTGAVPPLDTTRHAVPLEDIVFDTFGRTNRGVSLPEASSDLVLSLRDAIPPIHAPKYEGAGAGDRWLAGEDVVLGYVAGEEAWAFPVRILNLHEIVNDELGAEPVLISYCPLCASGVVFDRRLGGRTLTFGNTSALYESDMVMLDYETGSYWWQVAGRAIVGPLTGDMLQILPSMMLRWDTWKELHPDTQVLSRDTGAQRDYSEDPFLGYGEHVTAGRFAFPVSDAAMDGRLRAGTRVLGVRVGMEARAFPLEGGKISVFAYSFGGVPVVVFSDGEGGGGAYRPFVDDRMLTFRPSGNRFRDRETGSQWTLAGEAVEGQLAGQLLEAVPARTAFWFAIVASDPEIVVHGGR